MGPIMELWKGKREEAALRRIRMLLARHLAEQSPDPAAEPAIPVRVIPISGGIALAEKAFSASAKDFFDVTFSLVTTDPLPRRELLVGIATEQVLSLFQAETGEASFLGGRLWQTEVELTGIVDGEQYERLSSLMR